MTSNQFNNPQNPYLSCIVQASAGSGKTYQLSRRFLNLVSSGASPSEVLTITFTKKAAQEMRQRIISDASELLKDPKRALEFNNEINDFYKNYISKHSNQVVPPKSAIETAKEILSQTQSLKISTIDSLFNEWVSRFTYESSDGDFPSPYNLTSQEEDSVNSRICWSMLFKSLDTKTESNQPHLMEIKQVTELALDILESIGGEFKSSTISKIVDDLVKNDSILWQSQQHGDPIYSFKNYETPYETSKEALESIKHELSTIINTTSKPEKFSPVFEVESVDELSSTELFTNSYTISGKYIKGKKKESLASEIDRVESVISAELNKKTVEIIKASSKAFLSLYFGWEKINTRLKNDKRQLSFSDITKGAYNLLTNTSSSGAAWVIQRKISHLLLDEFQDTSLLQWDIFHTLSKEIVSSFDESLGYPNTTFIVGDIKQSIYGFRQADPTVMQNAKEFLVSNGHHEIPMNKSFRTSNLILEYVNQVFSELMDSDFPLHSTAELNGKPFIPDHSKVIVFDQFEDSQDSRGEKNSTEKKIKSVENEAEALSDFIKYVLENPEQYPVYKNGTYRNIKASDIAILYKNKTKSESFERALRKRGIASIKEEQNGYFERQEIKDLMALIQYIAYPSDHLSLIQVLKSPIVGLRDDSIIDFFGKSIDKKSDNLISTKGQITEYYKTQLNDPQASEYIAANRLLVFFDLLSKNKYSSLKSLIYEISRELSVSESYKTQYRGKEGSIAYNNIYKFIQLLQDIENDGHSTVYSVLNKLKSLKESDLEGNALSDEDAVKMMTIHKSKGLEFPMVFVVETAQNWFKKNTYWEPVKDSSGNSKLSFLGFGPAKKLISTSLDQLKLEIDNNLYSEALRVLYVAMTRASQYLIISGNTKDAEKREASEKDRSFYNTLHRCSLEIGAKKQEDDLYSVISREQPIIINQGNEHIDKNGLFEAAIKGSSSKDLDITSPHSELTSSYNHFRSVQGPPAEFSADLGSYFHRLIEVSAKKKKFLNKEKATSISLEFVGLVENKSHTEKWVESYYDDAKKAYETILAPLFNNAKHWYSEIKIVYTTDDMLVKGICDLVIEFEDKVLVIDHKTTGPENKDHAFEYCKNKSYDKQLEAYTEGIRKIFPEKSVIPAVLLSRTHQLVELT